MSVLMPGFHDGMLLGSLPLKIGGRTLILAGLVQEGGGGRGGWERFCCLVVGMIMV